VREGGESGEGKYWILQSDNVDVKGGVELAEDDDDLVTRISLSPQSTLGLVGANVGRAPGKPRTRRTEGGEQEGREMRETENIQIGERGKTSNGARGRDQVDIHGSSIF